MRLVITGRYRANDAITSSAGFSNVKNFCPVELRLKSERLAFQDGFQWNSDVRSVILMINKNSRKWVLLAALKGNEIKDRRHTPSGCWLTPIHFPHMPISAYFKHARRLRYFLKSVFFFFIFVRNISFEIIFPSCVTNLFYLLLVLYLLLLYLLLTELQKLRIIDSFNSYSLYVGESMK